MRGVRKGLLLAGLISVILTNALVFGALGVSVGQPTPRPTHLEVIKTFTPNPELSKRRVTPTDTPTVTPTRFPTAPTSYPTETRVPRNQMGEY